VDFHLQSYKSFPPKSQQKMRKKSVDFMGEGTMKISQISFHT